MAETRPAPPYSLLAQVYDVVMAHVDYVRWAEYTFELIEHYHPGAVEILELGCGTASLAIMLQPLGGYMYHASDLSEDMLAAAREKSRVEHMPIAFSQMDFRAPPSNPKYDVILLLYDGVNYLTEKTDVDSMLRSVFGALRPGGIFIFDQSTPANSLNNSDGFDDAGMVGDFHYLRTSQYDAESRLHTTHFKLDFNSQTYTESHVQRSYGLKEMIDFIEASPLRLEASFDGFTFEKAEESSERIHHVLRRPLRG